VNAQALRGVGIHHQHVGHAQYLGDGREVDGRVIGHLAVSQGLTACVAVAAIPMVRPSGAALATVRTDIRRRRRDSRR
jgi:hypothetical protein